MSLLPLHALVRLAAPRPASWTGVSCWGCAGALRAWVEHTNETKSALDKLAACQQQQLTTIVAPAPSPQARFIKLCKETRLVVAGQLSTTDADLIFASVKDRAARRISFEQVS